jgi:lysophospholipase L1-like esterase
MTRRIVEAGMTARTFSPGAVIPAAAAALWIGGAAMTAAPLPANAADSCPSAVSPASAASVQPAPSSVPGSHPDQVAYWEQLIAAQRRATAGGPYGLVFLGDSITEQWTPQIMQAHFGAMRPVNLGIPYDRTQNVLWRLKEGIFPAAPPKAVVLLVGTNNLSNRQGPEETALGVAEIVRAVRAKAPSAKILLVSILPRTNVPLDTIRRANGAFAGCADGSSIHYLDATALFLRPNGGQNMALYQGDGLHLGPAGYEALSAAVEAKLRAIGAV